MPFTTRPSLTSRQGMILRAGKAECPFDCDASFPQGLADNRTIRRQAGKIIERGNAARRLNLEVGQAPPGFLVKREIGALEHAVTPDIGKQQMAGLRKFRRYLPQILA